MDSELRKELTPEQIKTVESGKPIGLTVRVCTFTCNNCGETWEKRFGPIAWAAFQLFGTRCPNCGKKNYNYHTAIEIISVAIAVSLASIASYWFF